MFQEFQVEYSTLVEKTEPIGVYFAKTKEGSMAQWSKRQNVTQKRAYRFPTDALSEYTQECIKYGKFKMDSNIFLQVYKNSQSSLYLWPMVQCNNVFNDSITQPRVKQKRKFFL